MSKRLFVFFSVLIIASMVLTGCGKAAYKCTDAIGCVDVAPNSPIHIAGMLTITGSTSALGIDSKGGVEIAIDDRGGKLLGHDIQFTVEDSGCSAEGGQTAATKVASDPTVLGVIGTNCSSAATAAIGTISKAGLVMISSSNTAPALTIEGQTWQPGYYRTAHTDLFQGKVAADFAYNVLKAKTAATIHDGSPYAEQLQAVFAQTFKQLGGTITYQGAVNVGDTDMRGILTTVGASKPDLLYFPIFEPEGDFIVAQSSEIDGLKNTKLMGADGLLAATLPKNAGPNAVGMYLSGPYVHGAAYDSFLKKWAAKYGGTPPSGFHAFAYDAANILMDAIAKVAVKESDGTLHIGRQAIRDYITNLKNYQGLTGTLDCTDKTGGVWTGLGTSHGDCATGQALAIFQITKDQMPPTNAWPPKVVYQPE